MAAKINWAKYIEDREKLLTQNVLSVFYLLIKKATCKYLGFRFEYFEQGGRKRSWRRKE